MTFSPGTVGRASFLSVAWQDSSNNALSQILRYGVPNGWIGVVASSIHMSLASAQVQCRLPIRHIGYAYLMKLGRLAGGVLGFALVVVVGSCRTIDGLTPDANRYDFETEGSETTDGSGVRSRPGPNGESSDRSVHSDVGSEIVVCGRRYSIDAPVVLWSDPGGYNAYSTERHFLVDPPPEHGPRPGKLRYDPGRISRGDPPAVLFPSNSQDLSLLGEVVDQFVLHYDVCGTSQQCFRILHDHRALSVHFLLDIDGTLYQTCDVREQCWHATKANPRSIGVEIAHIGGRPRAALDEIERWYRKDALGDFIQLPKWMGDGGVRTHGFVGRPARPGMIEGRIQGGEQFMYDYTPEQYDTLVKLAATLCELFPNMHSDAPRDATGEIMEDVLSTEQYTAFGGILGHHHVQRNKVDPGVAFQWEMFLDRVAARIQGF